MEEIRVSNFKSSANSENWRCLRTDERSFMKIKNIRDGK